MRPREDVEGMSDPSPDIASGSPVLTSCHPYQNPPSRHCRASVFPKDPFTHCLPPPPMTSQEIRQHGSNGGKLCVSSAGTSAAVNPATAALRQQFGPSRQHHDSRPGASR